jgi:hypothetical protein
MKLPASIGQKKMKAIEQVLEELGIEFNPMPTDDVVVHFNELRQDIVLLYELKLAMYFFLCLSFICLSTIYITVSSCNQFL